MFFDEVKNKVAGANAPVGECEIKEDVFLNMEDLYKTFDTRNREINSSWLAQKIAEIFGEQGNEVYYLSCPTDTDDSYCFLYKYPDFEHYELVDISNCEEVKEINSKGKIIAVFDSYQTDYVILREEAEE